MHESLFIAYTCMASISPTQLGEIIPGEHFTRHRFTLALDSKDGVE